MYKINDSTDNPTYLEFDFPEDISGLDIQIIKNTLDMLEFIAEMSDSYTTTRQELQVINSYRHKHNL